MRSRCAATSATSSQFNSSVSSTSSTIAGMPRPRNTHSATVSCRLSSPIMSATPNAYWRTCCIRRKHPRIRLAVMHCSMFSSLCLEQTHSSPQSTAWELREAAERCQLCGRSRCAETMATLAHSLTHPHSLHSPTQKNGVMGKGSPPHNARIRNAIHVAPQDKAMRTAHTRWQQEGRGASNSTALSFTSLFSNGLASHTHNEARRTPSAPLRVRSAGQHPVTLVPSKNGKHKQSSSRTIGASSREKKEMRAFQQHSQQWDTRRDAMRHSNSGYGNNKSKPPEFAKKKKNE
ncbi:hypothetical protein ECC02_011150 [Trypanosoma cruzi]|uniref:Uncharacterized protein n=1 Tax=Trypanosoma cruzi TaxID=5693 RepID=A0A7J6XNL8_TRYCR|nr:hypothetical protein ECC02_011150 [Trypanosoma cruzi]